jgi:O-antigen biosynthesis protein WbqV
MSARAKRNFIAVLHDAIMAALSFLASVYLRLGDDHSYFSAGDVKADTFVFTCICMSMFVYMRLYRGMWRYASMQDMVAITKAVTLSILIFSVFMFIVNRLESVPRSVLAINWLLLLVMLGGPRFVYRAFKDRTLFWRMTMHEEPKIPVLLVGAGDHAEQFIRHMRRDGMASYEAVGIVDDDPKRKGLTIHRVPVLGNLAMVREAVDKLDRRKARRPQKIIVTDDRLEGSGLRHLLDIADELGIPLARLPRLSEFKSDFSKALDVRPIAVEDLLGRPQNVLDRDAMQKFVEGNKVLVTGAGGTIGSELTRQIASYNPRELILLELGEFNLYQIEREIRASFPGVKLETVLCDVRDVRHIESIFRKYAPQVVFHAAAIKHVPIGETNAEETILTNVFGTRNIAEACRKHGTAAMVMISTDKAVNPTNVMGATKRLAESFCQALAKEERGGNTKFITVRFGNVLGSTGSVVPLFQEQLSKGGPLTVTHQDMTRYFMTVREAVELVLQAAVLGAGMQERRECIFVLDMGQPVRIRDLAEQMIRLAGLRPGEDIKIVYTGLRPGEKLYEELFHFSENAVKTAHDSIFLASPRFADISSLRKTLEALFAACTERKTPEALALLKRLVPEFQTLSSQAKAL